MDAKIIKNQISYWESQEKSLKADIKVANEQLKTVQTTIKALKTLVGKDEEDERKGFPLDAPDGN